MTTTHEPQSRKIADFIKAEVAEYPDLAGSSIAQWRQYLREEGVTTDDYFLTNTRIIDLLGVQKGEFLCAAIEQTFPTLGKLLYPKEGGLNVNHPEFDFMAQMFLNLVVPAVELGGQTILPATSISADDVAMLQALGSRVGVRYELIGINEPREGWISRALQMIEDEQ